MIALTSLITKSSTSFGSAIGTVSSATGINHRLLCGGAHEQILFESRGGGRELGPFDGRLLPL